MTNYAAGRRREWAAKKMLEALGYTCVRTAGSRGPVDLVAWNDAEIRLIQCKTGKRALGRLTPLEREQLELMPVPPSARVEVWRWVKGTRLPVVEVV